jgi:hypothetical protein
MKQKKYWTGKSLNKTCCQIPFNPMDAQPHICRINIWIQSYQYFIELLCLSSMLCRLVMKNLSLIVSNNVSEISTIWNENLKTRS